MKHLMTLLALVVAVTAGAQVMDTTLTGNSVHLNLNYAKLDSIIADLQAKVATLEAAQTSAFDGTYGSLTGAPTIPSNVSDLTNDAGFVTFSEADSIAVGVAWRKELQGADLAGFDFNTLDFNGAEFVSANLSNTIFSNANLSNADFSNADLTDADLSLSDLSDANMSGADLSGADLTYAALEGTDFSNADLSGANLSADFSFATLTGVTWTGAIITECTGCTCIDANSDEICD